MQGNAQMESLNARRVSLKHHGQLPSSLDVEAARVYVTDFFRHNTPVFFDCNLEDVSLEVMITYPSVREQLKRYHEFISQEKYGKAQAECQIALREFLNCYYEGHGKYLSFQDGPGRYAHGLNAIRFEPNIDDYLFGLKQDILKINEAINVMNLGISYSKYHEFVALGPRVNDWPGADGHSYEYQIDDESRYTKETAEQCFNFVIETALKIQGMKPKL